MGQKVNPHGLRVGVIKDWDSRWFVKDEQFGDMIVSDYNIRKYLQSELKKDHEKDKEKNHDAGVAKIEIERDSHRVRVFVHCAKPGIVIGRGGAEIEKYKNTPKGASEYLVKLLKSAMANAENNFQMDPDKLYVSECYVCPGPTLKRIMPRAQGSADRILKRTSHMTIVLKERD